MLTFLFGSSGSGKTAYIVNQIKENVKINKKTYLLVPEQQVYISECMLADLPASSALCFEVLSFSRLCELVFGVYGGIIDTPTGSGARNLIMWQSLREISHCMTQYKNVKVDSSLCSMMLSAVDELHANTITAEQCEKASESCENPILSRKLSDLSLIYSNFNKNLQERIGESAIACENKLARLATLLSKNKFFAGCTMFVDSFTSFTAEEFLVLEQLATQCEEITVSFTYKRGDHAPHTLTLSKTVSRLTAYANKHNIPHRDIYMGDSSSKKSKALDILEKHLWDFSMTKEILPDIDPKDTDSIEMYVCYNEYEEMWLSALNILRLHNSGVAYSEIALIMRDPEGRKGIIEAVFDQLNIPYFYSEKTDLSMTAPARLIMSALRCIAYNFNLADIMTLIKTGLLGISEYDADLFEDYCYTWNINGNLFVADAWSMNPDGYTTDMSNRAKEILDAANRVRSQIIPPLVSLRREFSLSKGDTSKNCRAIYNYIDAINLSDNLSDMAESSLGTGNVKEAGELLRVYDYIVSALTDICTSLGNTQTSVEDLISAVEIMLKNTDIGSVPSVNDYVTVGSAATLRVENVKAALLVGLCEGEFPANYSDSGIFTERDKSIMDEMGLSLSSREYNVNSDELFFVYRAMTKPQDKLILSTCKSSVSGRVLNPSSAWNRVKFLFPDIKQKSFDLDRVRTVAALINEEVTADTEDQAEGLLTEEVLSDEVQIDPMYVRMLFGDNLRLSKSQISTFAECPYRYWCEYVLKLREQKVSAVSYADSGTIIHYVLEKILKQLQKDDGSLEQITDSDLTSMVDRSLNTYISDISCPLPPSMMYSFSRIRDLSLIMARSVLDEFEQSKFKIVAFEKSISDKRSDALHPMEIRLGDDESSPVVSLGGVVDRIDCYEGEDRRYLRIVDYKTGSHPYNVKDISTGKDLQLPAYLFTAALEENKAFYGGDSQKQIFPASAIFLSADEKDGKITPVRSGFMLSDDELLTATSANKNSDILAGISFNKDGSMRSNCKAAVTEEIIRELDGHLRSTIADIGRNMYSGRAPRTPGKDACKFCTFKSTCPVAYE